MVPDLKSVFGRSIQIGMGLAVVAAVTVMLSRELAQGGLPGGIHWGLAVLGSIMYLLAHGVRAWRLQVLAGLEPKVLKALVPVQLQVNGANLLLPFKLGEVYRIVAMGRLLGGVKQSFVLLLVERMADFTTVLTLLVTASLLAPAVPLQGQVLAVALVLLAGIMCFAAMGRPAHALHRRMFAGSGPDAWQKIGKLAARGLRVQQAVAGILYRHGAAAAALTVLVWGLEVAAFAMFWPVLGGQPDALLFLAAAVFLSSLLPSGPAGYGGVQLAFYWVGTLWGLGSGFVTYSLYYNAFIFVPAMLLAGIIMVIHPLKKRTQNAS